MSFVSAEQLLTFGLAAFILIVIPGPSVVFVIGRALSYGQHVAVASVVGNTAGLLVAMTLVSIGLGVVVAESIVVFTVLKFVGAAYLVWLGVQAIRRRSGLHVADAVDTAVAAWPPRPAGRDRRISNPKGFMIFAALLPQFVVRSQGSVDRPAVRAGSARGRHRLRSPTRLGRSPPASSAPGSTRPPDAARASASAAASR